ncbi:hypothetical protein NAS2_1026 [Conexivisphaera calida]|uniref:Uncharacterized protein n=2 Tax=Conexivisphaera calida TaxID=1874277 RepID=A0A4P2VN95_9ARCH|nr:hypothetical protein NAS2_1026 [Conexivisphaera calida]
MLGALILIVIVLVGAFIVYSYVWSASGRITGAPGVMVSGASLTALPGGGGYMTVDITNTGGVTGFASVAVYSSSGQVFSAPGAPGLLYQIYYIPTAWYQPDPTAVYSAGLAAGSSFSSDGFTWVASAGPWTTAQSGSSQNVNGQTQPNVIDNLQAGYSGGAPFPNPPVANGWDAYAIKEIGYVVVTQPTTFYVDIDGGLLSVEPLSQGGASLTNWLGTGSNPGNLINQWRGEGATQYSSNTVQPGTYLIEYDWFNGGGPAYFSLWTNNPVQYYSPLQIAPGQVANESYTVGSGIAPGDTYTVVVTLTTPRGTATSSATVVASP